jgi:DegV family protein with EDD domain
MSIHVVIDSTADIPQSVREELGITMVPLKVHFGSDTYLDNITLQPEQFYKMLKESAVLPTTSQPSPVDFLEVYKKILEDDPDGHIISIHLSAAMSGTYQSAVLAKSMLDDPERVTVIDSRSASYANGMLAVAAAKAARSGKDKDGIVALIGELRRTYKVYFLVDTLEYLQKGGRIAKASAVLGSLLNIKPVLSIDDDGEVAPVDKVRGSKKAVQRIIELLRNEYGDQQVDITILHTDDPATAEQLAAQLKEHFRVNQVAYAVIGPVIGTHAGPGTLGVLMGPTPA